MAPLCHISDPNTDITLQPARLEQARDCCPTRTEASPCTFPTPHPPVPFFFSRPKHECDYRGSFESTVSEFYGWSAQRSKVERATLPTMHFRPPSPLVDQSTDKHTKDRALLSAKTPNLSNLCLYIPVFFKIHIG